MGDQADLGLTKSMDENSFLLYRLSHLGTGYPSVGYTKNQDIRFHMPWVNGDSFKFFQTHGQALSVLMVLL